MYKSQYDNGISTYQGKFEVDPKSLPAEFTPEWPADVDGNKRLSDLTQAELASLQAYSDARRFAQIVITLSPGDINGNSLSSGSYQALTQLSSVTVTTDSTKILEAVDVSTAAELDGGIQPAKPKMLQLTNLGSVGVYLNFGAAATLDKGFYIPAGGQMVLTGLDIPKCDVYGITGSSSAKIVIGLL